MSIKEINRAHVIRNAVDGKCTVKQAAELLRLSPRRIKQLKKEFNLTGAAAVIHGNARRTSPKSIAQDKVAAILSLRQDKDLNKSNFTHFAEMLLKKYQIHMSYSSLYRKLFHIEQNKFHAKTKVTLLLSEKHGLRALINGEFYKIVPLDEFKRPLGVVRTGDCSKDQKSEPLRIPSALFPDLCN